MSSTKRGRPVSTDTIDPAVIRRRQLTAARVRQHREKNRATADITPPTRQQLQQSEVVIDSPITNIGAAQTDVNLGLRVGDLPLPQDRNNATLQRDAINVDEHDILYHGQDTTYNENLPHLPPSPSPSNNSFSMLYNNTPKDDTIFQEDGIFQEYDRMFQDYDRISQEADRTFDDVRRMFEPSPTPSGESSDLNFDVPAGRPISPGPTEDRIPAGGQLEDDREIIPDQEDQAHPRFDSEEGISIHNFSPRYSVTVADDTQENNTEEEDQVPISPREFTIGRIYDQLQGNFHGCSTEDHLEHLRQHVANEGDNHYGLDEIFNDVDFPSVLESSRLMTSPQLTQQVPPTPAQWQNMFCGFTPGYDKPMNVCLHVEKTRAVEPRVAFDIDSFLGFTSSLAAARQGLRYQPAALVRQNIATDVHIQIPVFEEINDPEQIPRSSLTMLKNAPHFLLGRIEGGYDITLYILFPHLLVAGDEFVALTQQQLSRWLDRIFHPAVYRYCEPDYTQHLPASYEHALSNSCAHQVEERLVETDSYRAQQAISYFLAPECLDQIWTEILDTIANTPGVGDFRDPQLFFTAKGTKLQFKTSPSRPTLLDALENFQAYFERIIDLDFVYLDRVYVDIGKEICPRVGLLPSQRASIDDEAQVYLWKRCCLDRYVRWLYDGQPPSVNGPGRRFYQQSLLRDACSLTSLTPKRSRLREGGLIYSQFYSSIKEVIDAAKSYPFQNDGLEEMALDPQIRQSARQIIGGRRRGIEIIQRAYTASKHRAHTALRDSVQKSFGLREEHRVSWSLFQGLLTRLSSVPREDLEISLDDCPSYAWPVTTEIYLNFLRRNCDKFATGFEVLLARCHRQFVTWEHTKMLAMFLRSLRFALGGYELRRESALWWSRRDSGGRVGQPVQTWYGLGFCNTLRRHGYCWIEPRIDWSRLTFQSRVTDGVLFGNNVLRGQYLRQGGATRHFFDITRKLELALEWLEQHDQNEVIQTRLIWWMVHLCLQQFRIDTLRGIKSEIVDDEREEALAGTRPFCFEYLDGIMHDGVYLISGNRCDFKEPFQLGMFLFSFDDGRTRTHWDQRPFRTLYRRAVTILRSRADGEDLEDAFSRRLWRALYAFHWILPYPCAEVLTQTTKQGERMWYSIQPIAIRGRPLDHLDPKDWQWARKNHHGGLPPAIPRYLSWTKEEWQGWMERHRTD
jgi:hypothetical protein